MKTRHGGYQSAFDGIMFHVRSPVGKRRRLDSKEVAFTSDSSERGNLSLEGLPDHLLTSIIVQLSKSAGSGLDLINLLLTCKRFCVLGTQQEVLRHLSPSALTISADSWSDGAYRLLRRCAQAGNIGATYRLGMIKFYCLEDRRGGATLLSMAAATGHADALHSLGIINFNGSGGTRNDRDVTSGVVLCAKAAFQGHVDALRELGHCLQDGYGFPQNVAQGRRLLLEASARELAQNLSKSCPVSSIHSHSSQGSRVGGNPLLARNISGPLSTVPSLNQTVLIEQDGSPKEVASTDIEVENHPTTIIGPQVIHGDDSAYPEPVQANQQGGHCSLNFEVVGSSSVGMHRASLGHDAASLQSNERHLTGEAQSTKHDRYAASGDNTSCPCPLATVQDVGPGTREYSVNQFLVGWYGKRSLPEGLKLCGNANCGRPETRWLEFRCCSACGSAKYCSRACQAHDWKSGHRLSCQQNMQVFTI